MEVVDLEIQDYRKVGSVYTQNDNDFLICYNQDGLCALNVDEELSHYEIFDNSRTNDIIRYGKCTFDNIGDYLQTKGGF